MLINIITSSGNLKNVADSTSFVIPFTKGACAIRAMYFYNFVFLNKYAAPPKHQKRVITSKIMTTTYIEI